MRNTSRFFIICLIINIGCGGCKQTDTQSSDNIIVDVTASYPEKKLVLQDFMDVEYIVLEANDEFVNQGVVVSVGKKFIMVMNSTITDGDIFIYDRNGKALRKINRRGQGSEEYLYISRFILDEDNSEIFVLDAMKKILVYDLYGNFRRNLDYKESVNYENIFNYDKDYLICDNQVSLTDGERNAESFFIISKKDGRIVKEIKIPFKQEKTPMMMHKIDGDMSVMYTFRYLLNPIIPHNGDFIITPLSSDTIYRCLPDHNIEPFIIRTPSIQSMNPEVFLLPNILTDRYYFMESVKKEYSPDAPNGFPDKSLMYDRHEKAIYEYTINNDDYIGRIENFSTKILNDEIAFRCKIEAFELIEANKQAKLKGKLKEIADGLDEDANPVIMLVKYK